jgi:signal transduction histidine kinase
MLRIYTIVSLVVVLVAGSALVVLYRSMVTRDIVADAESNNIALAQRALEPAGSELVDFLAAVARGAGRGAEPIAVPPRLDRALREMTRGPRVIGIKIFNRDGVISASTKSSLIGASESTNPGFMSAIDGRVVTRSIERGSAHRFDTAAAGLDLVESYVPVPLGTSSPQGVLEIYTDVTPFVQRAERTETRFLIFAVLIIAGLYAVLLLIVRWALSIVDARQGRIGDESALMTLLSQRSLRREEVVRKKLSLDLREDIAQTLSAIKLKLENAYGAATRDESDVLKSVVPGLQGAIGQVRAIATELRPPGLDDFGLVTAIKAMGREFGTSHPGIRVALQFKGSEGAIPSPLQIVIYRNIEVALNAIAALREHCDIWVDLHVGFRTVTLEIKEEGSKAYANGTMDLGEHTGSPLSPFRERTVISGGTISIARNEGGALILRASWNLQTGARRA